MQISLATRPVSVRLLGSTSACGAHTRVSSQWTIKETGMCQSFHPEAEIVAMDWALRREGIPMLDLWDVLVGRGHKVAFHGDNEPMLKICRSGKNPTMRQLLRTHGVSVAWLKKLFDTKL